MASRHSWTDNPETINNEDARKNRAMDTFRRISSELTAIIKAVNDSFVSDPLTVELFSAEGDALHQLMDCMFMGPMARMDYGSRGHRGTLPVPSWSRSNTEDDVATRSFPVPCTADVTHGDTKSPFTCGSEARRAVIKYFVRNYAGSVGPMGACGTDNLNTTTQDKNRQNVVNIVHTRLTQLYKAWSEFSKFGCQVRVTDIPESTSQNQHPKTDIPVYEHQHPRINIPESTSPDSHPRL